MLYFLLMHYVDESSILELRRVFRESFNDFHSYELINIFTKMGKGRLT